MASSTASGTNFFYPFQAQTNAGITPTGSGTYTFNIALSGWGSVNNAGFVFQTGQYNSKREGSGQ